ncbi:unnamed protein product [Owenia fusiformis]|nr:unnamed protein product [Owenia fusiformis]
MGKHSAERRKFKIFEERRIVSNKKGTETTSLQACLDEKRKLKESILKVFQAGEGVESKKSHPSKKESKQSVTAEKGAREKHTKPWSPLTHYLEMSDSDHNKPQTLHKIKRRKTKSERNKSKYGIHEKHEKDERSGIRRHMKTAEEMTGRASAVMHNNVPTMTSITQNRLTMRLGLFNKCKKSGKIQREALPVSDALRRRTDADIQRIIHNQDTFEDIDENSFQPMETDSYEPTRPVSTNSITSRLPESGKSVVSSVGSHTSGTGAVKNMPEIQKPRKRKSPYDEIQRLAHELEGSTSSPKVKSPPLSAAAKYLMSFMKPKVLFPGRNLNAETKEELGSLLRKNAPIATMTPQKVASPASSCTKRSLLDCLPPSQESQHSLSQSNSQMSQNSDPLNLKAMDDAKTLLYFNEQARKLSQESPKFVDQSSGYKPHAADALCRESGLIQKDPNMSYMEAKMTRSHLHPGTSKGVQNMEVDCYPSAASNQRIHMWKNIPQNKPTGSVITQYRVDPHTQYRVDSQKFSNRRSLDDMYMHDHNNSSAYLADISNLGEPDPNASDLLDFIDKEPRHDHLYNQSNYMAHASDMYYNNTDIYSASKTSVTNSAQEHVYYGPRSMKLKSGTPDSESGSPVWYIPVVKASMQEKLPPSPKGSPPKLYRHKLY